MARIAVSPDGATIENARLPFAEQIAFFRQKLGNLIPTERWDDILRNEHDKGFMVAGAMKADLLADLAKAVDQTKADGQSIQWFRKNFFEIVAKHGWTGWTGSDTKKGRAWRTRVIYQTNLLASYAAGRLAQLKDAGYRYWIYHHDDSVRHPRPLHQAWDGLILAADHDFWKAHYPPNGWGCFPGSQSVRCNAKLGLKTWYAGEIVEITTRQGNRFVATANHPVLTRKGWIAAHRLAEGEELLSVKTGVERPSGISGVVDDQEAEASAEDLFEALAAQGLRPCRMSPLDFHGDAHLRKGDIHIAGPDAVLVDVINAASRKLITEFTLESPNHGVVRGKLISSGAAKRGMTVADAVFSENPVDAGSGIADFSGQLRLADTRGGVTLDDVSLHRIVSGISGAPGGAQQSLCSAGCGFDVNPPGLLSLGQTAQRNTSVAKSTSQRASAAPNLFRQLLDASPGKIALDQVVQIRKFQWSGHVYDFVTDTGLILAGGVVVSNCQCYISGARSERGARRLGGDPDKKIDPEWLKTDPKTGAPVGIDKGWDYMPGATVVDTVRALRDKLDKLPPQPSVAVIQDWLKTAAFAAWLDDPQGAWPLARLPDEDAGRLGANAAVRVAYLSAESAAKQAKRHPELTPDEYLLAQRVVDAATAKVFKTNPTGTRSVIYIQERARYVLVVKATQEGDRLFITSFYRLHRDEARRDAEISRLLRQGRKK